VGDPGVENVLKRHPNLLSPEAFFQSAADWVQAWERKGGVPYLWIQLDAGLPAVLFARLRQTCEFFVRSGLSERIRLFAIMPSSEYWGEQLIRSRNRKAGVPEPGEERHPGGLLWAFGRCSQDFQSQIVEPLLSEGSGGVQVVGLACPDSLLGRLQDSCRRSAPSEQRHLIGMEDFSLSVHSAHHPLRELEVCRDRILQALVELPGLRCEEVLVLLANPKEQALYVEAAFGGAGEASLPFRLLGFGQAIPSPFATALALLTGALGGRLSLADIQKLLEHPLVAQRFGLDIVDGEPKRLVEWLRDAGFRWGIDAGHRKSVHAFEEERWNLAWAVQRLGLGGIVSETQRQTPLGESFQAFSTLPLERASGLSLELLAKLAGILDALLRARPAWAPGVERSLEDWNRALDQLSEEFLHLEDPSAAAHAGTLRNSILPALRRTGGEGLLLETSGYLRLVQEKLQNLNDSASRGGGGVRVGDLRQMCGVPARLVVVAGLNCGSFPKSDDRPAWHPLAGASRPGDPSARDADRHALLLALLSARERLVLTYCGGSDEDQKERPPSTALADILEAVDAIAQSCAGDVPAHLAILYRHPLNGFSVRAFAEGVPPCVQGRTPSDHRAAGKLRERDGLKPYPGPWTVELPEEDKGVPSLEDLRALLREPARLFLARLGIRAPEQAHEAVSLDLIELAGLDKWSIAQELLTAQLEGVAQGLDQGALKERLTLSGRLPRGQLGQTILAEIEKGLPSTGAYCPGERIAATCRICLPEGDKAGGGALLEGLPRPGWYRKKGGADTFFYSASTLKNSQWKHELAFRVDALAIAAMAGERCHPGAEWRADAEAAGGPWGKTTGVFGDDSLSFFTPAPEEAKALLLRLFPLYRLARRVPLPFWPGASQKMEARAGASPEERERSLEGALEFWKSGHFNATTPPEAQAPVTRIAFRGLEDPMAWSPPVEAAFLPDPRAPFAWRIARFLSDWMSALPADRAPKATKRAASKTKK
jgi:exonuclease V gamma subunit